MFAEGVRGELGDQAVVLVGPLRNAAALATASRSRFPAAASTTQ
jgi:hypothetical protein